MWWTSKASASSAGDLGSIPGLGRSLEEKKKKMATHFSILAWKIPMNKGAWLGYSPLGHKESDMTEQIHFHVVDKYY